MGGKKQDENWALEIERGVVWYAVSKKGIKLGFSVCASEENYKKS